MLREMNEKEINEVYKMGYVEWGKNRSYSFYAKENQSEEKYGKRYVYTYNGEVVSSFVLYYFNELTKKTNAHFYGIASVVTKRKYRNRGFARKMLNECFSFFKMEESETVFLLFSEIDPLFYEKLGFCALPTHLQTEKDAVLMGRFTENNNEKIHSLNEKDIPYYF